jgi:hypothetical protein
MGDLYVLFIGIKPYLVSWMPVRGTAKICVKAWRLYGSGILISELGALATLTPPDGTGLARVRWDYSESLECVVRVPWPRAPDVTIDIAVPVPTKPKTGLIYSLLRWINPRHVAHREIPFNTGTTGWEYVRNLLLATDGFPTTLSHDAFELEDVEVRRGS